MLDKSMMVPFKTIIKTSAKTAIYYNCATLPVLLILKFLPASIILHFSDANPFTLKSAKRDKADIKPNPVTHVESTGFQDRQFKIAAIEKSARKQGTRSHARKLQRTGLTGQYRILYNQAIATDSNVYRRAIRFHEYGSIARYRCTFNP